MSIYWYGDIWPGNHIISQFQENKLQVVADTIIYSPDYRQYNLYNIKINAALFRQRDLNGLSI